VTIVGNDLSTTTSTKLMLFVVLGTWLKQDRYYHTFV